MPFRRRLAALTGLVVIVAVVIGGLLAGGLLGNQAGGKGIEDVQLLDPPRSPAQSGLQAGPEVGKLAPDFEISAFDGSRHRLSDFRGKVVYLNFWGTWCTPCLFEMPDIQQLLDRYGETLAVVSVNRRNKLSDAEQYLQELPRTDGGTGVSFTVNGMDPADTLYDTYVKLYPPPMPVSIFINAEGVITHVYNGLVRLPQMEQSVSEGLASTSAARNDVAAGAGDGHPPAYVAGLEAIARVTVRTG